MIGRLTLLLALSSLAAQTDPPQETPVFKTEVNLVEVDVHVLDRDGKFVDSLQATDFEVFEDGVPQDVAAFRLVDLPMPSQPFAAPDVAPVASDVITNESAAEGLVYALVLDDLHTAAERTMTVRQVARQFVEQWLGEGDLAAVTTTSGAEGASSHFTSNRQALLAAIDRFSGRQLRSMTLEVIELRDALLLDMTSHQSAKSQLRALDEQHAFRTTTALSHLRSMGDILRDIEGRRKIILYIGDGIPYNTDFIQAEDVGTVAQLDIRRAVGSTGLSSVSIYALDVRGMGTGQEDLMSVSRQNPAGALQTIGIGEGEDFIDPRLQQIFDNVGRESQLFVEEVRRSHDALRMLAAETGGLAAVNQNDLGRGLHDLIADNRRFYKLGYYPSNVTADGRFRKIEVRIKGQDLDVRARKGYIVPEEEDRLTVSGEADGLDSPLRRDLLTRAAPITDLPLRVLAYPFGLSEETYSVAVVVECDIHPFRFTEKDGRYHDKVVMSAIVLDGKGAWVTGQENKVDLEMRPSAREQMRRDGLRMLSVLDVPPGSYQLRVGVWEDGAEQKGSVFYDLALPSAAESEIAMSGILLSSKLEESVLVASATEVRQALPFLPSTRREFTPLDQVLAGVQIFRNPAFSKDQEVVLHTFVLDEQGKEVVESRGTSVFPADAPMFVRSRIDLSGFSTGSYVIDIQARDANGSVLTHKRNVFRVVDPPSTADLPLLADYMDLLETYRSGDLKDARNRLASWTDDRVKDVVEALVAIGEEPSPPEGTAGGPFPDVTRRNPDLPPRDILRKPKTRFWERTLRAAILLHTELSAYNAWGLTTETRAHHLKVAEGLVELIPGEIVFNRDWFLTVAYIYHGSNLSVSLHYLKEAGRRFPDDAEIHLASGVTYETAAALDKDRSKIDQAGTFYRRAIKADPDLAEAHLRLGKVLQERGGNRAEEASRELEWVVEHSSDPYLLYLANLFLGDLHKREKRFDRAVECYRGAVESEPRWQTAHISLSYALRATGDRAAAREVMQKALRLPVHDTDYVDGYRLYALGQLNRVPQMLNELRRGIME